MPVIRSGDKIEVLLKRRRQSGDRADEETPRGFLALQKPLDYLPRRISREEEEGGGNPDPPTVPPPSISIINFYYGTSTSYGAVLYADPPHGQVEGFQFKRLFVLAVDNVRLPQSRKVRTRYVSPHFGNIIENEVQYDRSNGTLANNEITIFSGNDIRTHIVSVGISDKLGLEYGTGFSPYAEIDLTMPVGIHSDRNHNGINYYANLTFTYVENPGYGWVIYASE